MNYKPGPIAAAVLALVVVTCLVAGGVAAWRHAGTSRAAADLSGEFQYDIAKLKRIEQSKIGYRQTGEWPLAMNEPRGLAVGPEDRVVVVGDQSAAIFRADSQAVASFPLSAEPRCVAVGGKQHTAPGRIYVGMKDHVEAFDPKGKRLAAWEPAGKRALFTSIAAGEDIVAVADAGSRLVRLYDASGKLLREIGNRDEAEGQKGFVLPSPYFDVAFSADGLLRVANTGVHKLEGYSREGHREAAWGEPGAALERFCGCCNPAHFALLPDGRYVTAEKGLPRVKIYTAEGRFETVVAGPEQLGIADSMIDETRDDLRQPVFDVAADSRGRVLLLDPAARKVRVFEPKGASR